MKTNLWKWIGFSAVMALQSITVWEIHFTHGRLWPFWLLIAFLIIDLLIIFFRQHFLKIFLVGSVLTLSAAVFESYWWVQKSTIEREVENMSYWLESMKDGTGYYPGGLANYLWKTEWTKKNIFQYRLEGSSYQIAWFVGDEGAHYFYSPDQGVTYNED
jgi:hypothetical protein